MQRKSKKRINESNLISGGQYRKYVYVYVTRASN